MNKYHITFKELYYDCNNRYESLRYYNYLAEELGVYFENINLKKYNLNYRDLCEDSNNALYVLFKEIVEKIAKEVYKKTNNQKLYNSILNAEISANGNASYINVKYNYKTFELLKELELLYDRGDKNIIDKIIEYFSKLNEGLLNEDLYASSTHDNLTCCETINLYNDIKVWNERGAINYVKERKPLGTINRRLTKFSASYYVVIKEKIDREILGEVDTFICFWIFDTKNHQLLTLKDVKGKFKKFTPYKIFQYLEKANFDLEKLFYMFKSLKENKLYTRKNKISEQKIKRIVKLVLEELEEKEEEKLFWQAADYDTVEEVLKLYGFKNEEEAYNNGVDIENSFANYVFERFDGCCEAELQARMFKKAFDLLPIPQQKIEEKLKKEWNIEYDELENKLLELFENDKDGEVFGMLIDFYNDLTVTQKGNYLLNFAELWGYSRIITKDGHLIFIPEQYSTIE